MGGPYANLFLNQMTQTWKDKYIHSFTSFSGAFGGAATAPLSIIGLLNMDQYLDPKILRNVIQSYGSIVWLSPSYQVYKDSVLVWTPTKNYTAADFIELYNDANAQLSAQILTDIDKYREILDAPGVPTNCIMGIIINIEYVLIFCTGYNVSTLYSFGYNETNYYDYPAYYEMVDGDGTVSTQGLDVCSEWVIKIICFCIYCFTSQESKVIL